MHCSGWSLQGAASTLSTPVPCVHVPNHVALPCATPQCIHSTSFANTDTQSVTGSTARVYICSSSRAVAGARLEVPGCSCIISTRFWAAEHRKVQQQHDRQLAVMHGLSHQDTTVPHCASVGLRIRFQRLSDLLCYRVGYASLNSTAGQCATCAACTIMVRGSLPHWSLLIHPVSPAARLFTSWLQPTQGHQDNPNNVSISTFRQPHAHTACPTIVHFRASGQNVCPFSYLP